MYNIFLGMKGLVTINSYYLYYKCLKIHVPNISTKKATKKRRVKDIISEKSIEVFSRK